MPSPNRITPSQLSRLIGLPHCPVIIDVCIDEDFDTHRTLLPTAVRHPHHSRLSLAPTLLNRRVVVICHKGLKLSQGAAALLRSEGIAAESLEGGIAGWRDAGLPVVPAEKIPQRDEEGRTLWITRQRPKIDRIACPWLIRRFIDTRARFLFVAPTEVVNAADRFGATPFDVDNVYWSHRGGQCTFDTMLGEFGLDIPALQQMAIVIRGADTNRLDLSPQSPGLLAASLGFSRMYRDDNEQLEASMALYDALYRWARDAMDETHASFQGQTDGEG